MTIHRFYAPPEQIGARIAEVLGPDAEQIRRVLRLKPGDEIELFDGSGRQVRARIIELSPARVSAEPLETTYPSTESDTPVILVQSLLKGERLDWIVEKATELGAAKIILFPAKRSVAVARENREERKRARWQRIAKEATEQCGRVKVPEVLLVTSLDAALTATVAARRWVADERCSGEEPASFEESLPRPAAILIGPEGGWDPEERLLMDRHGIEPISLGSRILRAETAALVALARLLR